MSTRENPLWLVGAGPMAQAYAKVLRALDHPAEVIGRGADSAQAFEKETGLPVRTGGLDAALEGAGETPSAAIIALPVDALAQAATRLISAGAKRLLVEKPAGLTPEQTVKLAEDANASGASVSVAYNRRYYASVLRAREMIEEDGGATSLRMEFSEFSHRIPDLPTPMEIKKNWLFANSTHVLDTGFFLAGFPATLSCLTAGELDWHPAGAQFVGHGTTETGAIFSFHADWTAAPRWAIEVGTRKRTLTLQPLEALRFREITGFSETQVELDDELDTRFKPGVYRQTKDFLCSEHGMSIAPLIDEHAAHMTQVYQRIQSGA